MKLHVFDTENWREIGATLARNKTRTFLTAFGIFWGTAMLAMLWGGADGLRGVLSRNFYGLSSNMGVFSPGTRSIAYRGFGKGTGWTLNEGDVATVRRVAPYIDRMSAMNFCSATAAVADRSKSVRLLGVDADYFEIQHPVSYDGRFFNNTDVAGSRKVVILGRNVANDLFPEGNSVGQGVNLSGIHFTVVGVAGQLGEGSIGGRVDDSILLPSSTLRRAFNQGTSVHFVVYTSSPGHSPADNEPAIRRALGSRHTIHPDDQRAFWFMDLSEMFKTINGLFMGITILAIFVGLASLLSGVIGVGNIMWIVVKERTQEFGVRRAIGAKPLDITVQVLSESILLTVVAGTAGVCFAAAVLGMADHLTMAPNLPPAGFQISFGRAMGILATFIVLGSLAGTLPAIKALKIKPIEALRAR